MTQQHMDPDWLVFHPNPKAPDFQLPKGAVDAHCHVFGPSLEFPFAPERKYTPCNAGKEKLFELRDHLGFTRNVIVQATCHGKDNRAMMDACRASGGLARGVASVGADITKEELSDMHDAGVRGVRFNFVKRLVDATPKSVFLEIAEKIQDFGWSIVVYFEAQDLADLKPFFKELPGIIVVDHINVAITATKEAILISVDGLTAIITPMKPKMIAVHLFHPIISFKKIIARMELNIGTAIEITVTSATGILCKE